MRPGKLTASTVPGSPHLAPGVRLQTDPLTGDPLALFPEGMLKLNPTGAAILQLCDGTRSVAQIVVALSTNFNAPANLLQSDIIEYVERLCNRGILELMPDGATTPAPDITGVV